MKLPPCHSRREVEPSNEVFFCAHPKVHAPDSLVRAEICRVCSYWKEPAPAEFRPYRTPRSGSGPCVHLGDQVGLRDCQTCSGTVRLKVFACRHPRHGETTFRECTICPDYESRTKPVEPLVNSGALVTTWAVGVTTAPRSPGTLERCLISLKLAGWETARIFAEPESPIPIQFAHLPVSRRDCHLGAWPNWFLGLSELVLRHPTADAYLMVQDDTVFCRGVREYLERVLWPADSVGLVSLYCPHLYTQRREGFHQVAAGWDLAGAIAFVFPNSAAHALLAHAPAVCHRRDGPDQGLPYIDSVVGRWAAHAGLKVYYQSPSLAQHIGNTSTIWPDAHNWGTRRSSNFAGEDFDARTLVTRVTEDVPPDATRGDVGVRA